MITQKFILTLIAGFAITTPAMAALSYTGSAIVSDPTGQPSLVAVGDVFHFTFTYDPLITDTSGTSSSGIFLNALTQFDAWAGPGNTGTWSPNGGTFTVPTTPSTTDDVGSPLFDRFFFGVSVSGLPEFTPGDAVELVAIQLESTNVGLVGPDTGTGQTLDEMLGGPLPTDVALYDRRATLTFAEDDGPGFSAQITNLAIVPEPSSALMVGLGCLGLAVFRRTRS